MKEESQPKQFDSRDTSDNSVSESSCSELSSASTIPAVASCALRPSSQTSFAPAEPSSSHRGRRDSSASRGERREPSTGRSRDGRSKERRRCKEPPSSDYLRALLHSQQRDGSTSVGEAPPAMVSVAQSRGNSENSSEAGVPATGFDAPRSGNVRNSLPPVVEQDAAVAATATVVSASSVAASPTTGDLEAVRRRTLFEIQRLMLEARPYDSIEFFHVQRELVKYLGLEPHRRVSATDYLLSDLPKQTAQQATVATAATVRAAEEGAASSRSSSAPASASPSQPTASASASTSKGFWNRLRSRWSRGGTNKDFKGDGDIDIFDHVVQSHSSSVSNSQAVTKSDAKEEL